MARRYGPLRSGSASAAPTPAANTARSSALDSVSAARRRLYSTMTGASAGSARRMVHGMVASGVESSYGYQSTAARTGPLRWILRSTSATFPTSPSLEYGSAELHVHTDGVSNGAHVLLVDDLLATGGTMRAGCQLVEKAGGRIVGCCFLVELSFLEGRAKLQPHEVFSLIRF